MAEEPTIAACATPAGGAALVLRLSGPRARAIAVGAGLPVGEGWRTLAGDWDLGPGPCPVRTLLMPGPRSATGWDVVEAALPGSAELAALALARLEQAGAAPAPAGGFTRQALANRRLSLDQAEAVLALVHAGDAAAAERALARLRHGLGGDCAAARARLLALRAQVESGLDFGEEDGVAAYEPGALRAEAADLGRRLGRWRCAADALDGVPLVALCGPANAGKSALFAALTGEPALVSAVPGTTRDWLEAAWRPGGRELRLADTAGWLDHAAGHDAEAIGRGRALAGQAALVLACSAPDAPLPAAHGLPADRTLVVVTKADLGDADARAAVAVSAATGQGLAELEALVAARLAGAPAGEPRQQRLLAEAQAALARVAAGIAGDELLAEELRRAADALGELVGTTTADQVLEEIFSRFCIGK